MNLTDTYAGLDKTRILLAIVLLQENIICGTVDILKFRILLKMLDIRAAIHKMLVRTANSEGPDQTASSEAV